MSENISKFFNFGNGTRVRPYMITAIIITEEGVKCTTGSGDELAHIKCAAAHRERLADLVADCCDAGKDFVQPDLAFLKEKAGK